ncbi:hypothetical protein [Kumtagia ephedrae]|uniref:TubC N-terminal docking domain-containing protein n=1 Tax=Kumtagia ephedrae TaxID=2116701 RepID=A0A2P7SPU5_9HYPH|nr:hypothetical protein [Mesorhizobium ephedrae]PSJ64486.1 hypothetical protein C7I84_05950 [Mesorhizobium ephedrae]
MADAAEIISRIRDRGANVAIDAGKLTIVDSHKLPAGSIAFIRANARAIADYLDREAAFEERAAILEYDGGLPRPMAEDFARLLLASAPRGVTPADWTWFCGKAAEIVERRAA